MKLTIIQLLAADIGQYENTSERIQQKINQACQKGTDLILLPECAYPAYMIGLEEEPYSLQAVPEFLNKMSALAARNKVYLAVGTPLFEEGELYNGVAVFDRKGDLIATACKSNLWHFDGKWFKAGPAGCLFDTEFGKIGVMICADGRIPEIARRLRMQGAQLILDAVNLVASASEPSQLTNQQYQFMLQTRARENGVYIAVCDKTGVESGTVTCLGRSMVVTPEGKIAAECSPDKEELLTYEMELPEQTPLSGRRPELYQDLAVSTDLLPVTSIINRLYKLSNLECFTAVIRFDCLDEAGYLEKSVSAVKRAVLMDSKLIVLPEAGEGICISAGTLGSISAVLPDGTSAVTAFRTKNGIRKAVVLKGEGVYGELPATHLKGNESIDDIKVLELFPGCSIAALFDWEMQVPEIARIAMLRGADILIWFDRENSQEPFRLMQTRAAENKIFALRVTPSGSVDYSLAVNPEGGKIFTTFYTKEQMASGMIHTALSKSKEVVPGTNIVYGRNPQFYKELTI